GRATLDQVTATMSHLAEIALQACADHHYDVLAQRHGLPCAGGLAQPFLAIGMGQLGGRELNVSSGVELIFVTPAHGRTDGARPGESQDFSNQRARRVIGAMSEVTEHGYVFRVDMRLGPNGDAGPLVPSLAALETYFFVQGREWERYAWI